MYASIVDSAAAPEVLKDIAGTHLSHPTDSHPPLATRLESLDISLESVSSVALDVRPENPAHGLIEDVEAIEEEISSAYQTILQNFIQSRNSTETQEESSEGSVSS